MSSAMFVSLVDNSMLLLALYVIYTVFQLSPFRYRRLLPILNGLMIASICVIIMSRPFVLEAGLFFDTRSILISVTALIFGPLATLLTVIAASVYRFSFGGSGTLPGLAIIITSALIGLAWRRWLYPKGSKWRRLNVYMMSVTVHITMLACLLLLPYPENLSVLRAIALPVMVIFPIASALLSLLLLQQQDSVQYREQLKQSEERFQALFDQAPLGYQALDINGYFIDVNQQWLNMLGYSREEAVGKWFGDFLPPTYREAFREKFPLFKSQGHIHCEFEMLHRSGRPILIAFEGRIRYGSMGEFKQTHCILQDITEERKAKNDYQLLFREMIDAFAVHEIICDEHGQPIDYRFLVVNPAFESMVGCKSDDLVGKTVLEVFPETEPYWIEIFGGVALSGEPARFENYSAAMGKYFSVSAYQPMPNCFACSFTDITERKQLEEQLRENIRDLLESQKIAHVGTWRLNLVTNQVVWSEELYKMYGFDSSIPPPPYTEHMKLFTPESWKKLSTSLEKTRTSGIPYELELETVKKDGSNGWMWVRGEAVKDLSGNITSLWGAAQDITEHKRIQNELYYLGNHDDLTGLFNRRFFEQALVRITTEENLPLSFIVCDINGLKLVNDSFGHNAGDMLLKKLSLVIQKACREEDIIARMGGDEFIILLPKTSAGECARVANHIKELASGETVDKIALSISYGYSTQTSVEQSSIEIIANAENHMYRRKLYERSSIRSKTIDLIMNALFEKSNREAAHSNRVGTICVSIASKLTMDKDAVSQLRIAGLIHDIGKIGIDEKILNKPGALTSDERRDIERHPEIGWRILSSTNEFSELAQSVLHHQEKWDGSGYPTGLKGEDIPLEARIISVADAYDAMTSHRSYRSALSRDEAVKELVRCSGTQFDPTIVDVFVNQVLSDADEL